MFCVDYRLAPEYRFPTAADDVRAGWDWLRTERGLDPDRMVIAGGPAMHKVTAFVKDSLQHNAIRTNRTEVAR